MLLVNKRTIQAFTAQPKPVEMIIQILMRDRDSNRILIQVTVTSPPVQIH